MTILSFQKPRKNTYIAFEGFIKKLSSSCIVLLGSMVISSWFLDKLFIKNISTGIEEELIFSDENIYVPGISLTQRDRDTDTVYLGYSSPKTPSRVYSYNLSNKFKVKNRSIPIKYFCNIFIVVHFLHFLRAVLLAHFWKTRPKLGNQAVPKSATRIAPTSKF